MLTIATNYGRGFDSLQLHQIKGTMKLSNFKLVKVTGSSVMNYRFKATVDVTTGLLFKKTENKEIYKEYAAIS